MSERNNPVLAGELLQLQFEREEQTFTGYRLAVRRDDAWLQLGRGRFGRLVYQDSSGARREHHIRPTELELAADSARLRLTWSDVDAVRWSFEYALELSSDPRQIVLRCRASPSADRKVLHWSGPTFYAGEGAFGPQKSDALFPGLEYLLDAEPSSDTAFAAERFAHRYVPHPYKISVPLMAVSHGGLAVGLLWDPNQSFGSAWRHPAAVFASPNRLGDQPNHLLGLFVPSVPRFVEENSLEAVRPFGASPQNPLQIEARLVGLSDAASIDVLKVWVDTYGLPELPAPHSYRENVDLCVRSYLDVAWDEQAQGWHHTLSDPWGPRYEPRVIAQLWRYGQWQHGDPALRARAREQVRRGLKRAVEGQQAGDQPARKPTPLPHLELAAYFGGLQQSLAGMQQQVRDLLAEQSDSGAWCWRPELIQIESFKTSERERLMGQVGDSATGLTADRARTVLRWALLTGDEQSREAGLRATNWCNAQRRPEGAQTWELHLHVPDILAAPYLVDINLDAYRLTGEAHYLAQAERWAWTGLPFTYLWAAYYRPIMAYCSIPVFGVTFHDVQSWFGVDVHWNGLVYADALFRLARETGEQRWRQLAEGLTAAGMQQQPLDGEWLGMYPDAVSLVRGEEEYTWWLNPNLIGLNTFELAGIPLDIETHVLRRDARSPLLLTSGARLAGAQAGSQAVTLLLDEPIGTMSQTIVAGAQDLSRVACEGVEVAQVSDIDQVEQGWQWLPELKLALIKLHHAPGRTVSVSFEAA